MKRQPLDARLVDLERDATLIGSLGFFFDGYTLYVRLVVPGKKHTTSASWSEMSRAKAKRRNVYRTRQKERARQLSPSDPVRG